MTRGIRTLILPTTLMVLLLILASCGGGAPREEFDLVSAELAKSKDKIASLENTTDTLSKDLLEAQSQVESLEGEGQTLADDLESSTQELSESLSEAGSRIDALEKERETLAGDLLEAQDSLTQLEVKVVELSDALAEELTRIAGEELRGKELPLTLNEAERDKLISSFEDFWDTGDFAGIYNMFGAYAKTEVTRDDIGRIFQPFRSTFGKIEFAFYSHYEYKGVEVGRDLFILYYRVKYEEGPGGVEVTILSSGRNWEIAGVYVDLGRTR